MTDVPDSAIQGIIATTKPTVLTSSEHVVFARQALEGMITQIGASFIPLSEEHLTICPPLGRVVGGSLEPTDDGYEALVIEGVTLPVDDRDDDTDPFAPVSAMPKAAPAYVEVDLQVEPRNFEPEVWKELAATSPQSIHEIQKWSSLPPIEWLLAIPVTWGAAKFAGSFLERLGGLTADRLTKWIGRASDAAKESGRDWFVTLSFDLADGRRLLGFVPFSMGDDLAELGAAVDSAGKLAEIAGSWRDATRVDAHIVAYLYSAGEWRLAWFVTDSTVFRTPYFVAHLPDPSRFLEA